MGRLRGPRRTADDVRRRFVRGWMRSRAVDYLEKSYKKINNDGYVKRYILNRCRGEVIPG